MDDVRVWAYWNYPFGMHLSHLGPESYVFISWVSSGLISLPSAMVAISDVCDFLCLPVWQVILHLSERAHQSGVLLLSGSRVGTSEFEGSVCCSVAKLCPALCDPMDCSTPGLPVLHYLPEFAQTHVHWVGDTIQPSHPLSPPFPPALNLSQHQGIFQWVDSVLVNFKHLNEKLKHGKRKKPSSS